MQQYTCQGYKELDHSCLPAWKLLHYVIWRNQGSIHYMGYVEARYSGQPIQAWYRVPTIRERERVHVLRLPRSQAVLICLCWVPIIVLRLHKYFLQGLMSKILI